MIDALVTFLAVCKAVLMVSRLQVCEALLSLLPRVDSTSVYLIDGVCTVCTHGGPASDIICFLFWLCVDRISHLLQAARLCW